MIEAELELQRLRHRVDSLETVVEMLERRTNETDRVLMIHDEELDTGFRTPLLKRILFAIDGWPRHRLAERPARRPWRRWWTS